MLCRSVGSESMSHSGLLDGEGPRSNQRRLRCALSPAGSYDCQAAFTDKVDELLLIHSTTLQQQPMRRTQGTACGITVSDAQEGIRAE
jgi:hypothetical protein